MKKKLTGCLIGCLLVLLFMTTPAFAHIKADGTKCQSEGYNSLLGSENQTETQHRMQCITCYEIMWENHWRDPKDEPTCKKQVRCGLCGVKFGPFGEHKFSTATCVAKATCTVCKLQTGEIDPNNHDLKPSAAKAPTCTEKGWDAYDTCTRCSYTTYRELPALNHNKVHHDAKAATCLEIGWDAYEACTREGCTYTTKKEIPALNHDIEKHATKTPTCTGIGWDAYEACTREGCTYTTYQELPALGHDKVHHDAKAATCTEIGWEAYDTCKKCDYTTYEEIPAPGHDLEHHEAKAATCTEIGWEAYDTCKKCDYTTYVELPALGHDYQKTVVKPTCEKDGYTRFTCTRCQDTYTENSVKKLYHWYGEWNPNGDDTHSANCLRKGCKHIGKTDCQKFEFIVAENETLIFCPVCGEVENGTRLERIEKAMAVAETGKLPAGELIARMNDAYLSLAFEYAGKVATPTGQVKITLPAELLAGKKLTAIALDGTETEVAFEIDGEEASFTLDFTADEIPVILIRLTDAA